MDLHSSNPCCFRVNCIRKDWENLVIFCLHVGFFFHSPATFLNSFMQSIFLFRWSFFTIFPAITQLSSHPRFYCLGSSLLWKVGKWILFSWKSLLLSYSILVPFYYLKFLKSFFLEVNLVDSLLSFLFPPSSLQARFSFPLNLQQIFIFCYEHSQWSANLILTFIGSSKINSRISFNTPHTPTQTGTHACMHAHALQ